MKRHVLITGASGFIGYAFKQRLLTAGYDVSELNSNSDITEPKNFSSLTDRTVNHVFHLAARTFVPDSWKAPQSFYHTNVMGTENVLEFCRVKSIPLVYMSAYLYGRPESLPISEDAAIKPNNPYAHSKYLAEQLCQFYANEFEVNTVVLRPFNIYGPGQRAQFLVPLVISQALGAKEIRLKTLTPRRDYVYVDDVIDAALLCIQAVQPPFAVYNIGSGYSLSVLEVISSVIEVLGTDIKVVSDNEIRKNEIGNVFADISKANRELGWYPRHSFPEGIKKVIEYERARLHG